jgi:uncharacterized protein YggE
MRPHISLRQLVLTVLTIVVLGAAFALGTLVTSSRGRAVAAPLAQDTATSTQPQGLTVTGTATVTGTPDTLALSMSVSVTRQSVGDALGDANATTAKVFAALKKAGAAEKDLQTSGMSIQPQYNSAGSSVTGYLVQESLTARLRDLSKAGAAISAAVSAGGNAARVDSVTLDIEDTGAMLTSARAKAVDNAKTKATQYADAAGRGLGALISLSENVSSSGGPYPTPYSDLRSAASPVPVHAGSQDLVVTVTAVYGLS